MLPDVRFELEQTIPASYDDVVTATLDERYQRSLTDLPPLEHRELIEQFEDGDGRTVRITRCTLAISSGGAVSKFIGDSDPAWKEEATWHPEDSHWEWHILPEVAKELLSAKGRIVLEERGDETVRTITGEVKVRVPLYGGRVEGWIVEGLEHAYGEEADRLVEWLERENA
jgi:hypothetical protein